MLPVRGQGKAPLLLPRIFKYRSRLLWKRESDALLLLLIFCFERNKGGNESSDRDRLLFSYHASPREKSEEAKKETLGQQHPFLFFSSKASGAKALNEAN